MKKVTLWLEDSGLLEQVDACMVFTHMIFGSLLLDWEAL
jgi:hypothetical protein